jgi:hypothetical protein
VEEGGSLLQRIDHPNGILLGKLRQPLTRSVMSAIGTARLRSNAVRFHYCTPM